MKNYKKNATAELAAQGFTVSRIAESYGDVLLQNADPNRELVVGPTTLAAEFINDATSWPPKVSILGIAIPPVTSAITQAIADGADLIDVPEVLITQNMCEIAVDRDGYAIGQVPPPRYTDSLVLRALENGASLQVIPSSRQTEPMRLAAIEKSWSEIQFIRAEDQSEAVRLAAVKSSGHALRFIPVDERSDEVLLEAVRSQPFALEHIPDYQQTDEIMLEAVTRRGSAIQFIKKEDQSDEVLIAALNDKSFSPASLANGLRDDYRKLVRPQKRYSSQDLSI